ncbi:hypothetical protein L1987_47641 [Smallanthus sonchifolius]|uniref:Uncharacterized protein n=1 Tax=Smallanthus sonchifolius TaxID=185202 RepID=A0ACB9G3R2_9ASTR|nr:hypothetical protein L1987_47641 [Smallanthus sonchifolius]
MTSRMLLRNMKSSIISSRKLAWLLFAALLVFVYAMRSGGSAASEPIYKPSSKLTPARHLAVHSPPNSQSNSISNRKQNSVLSLLLSAALLR